MISGQARSSGCLACRIDPDSRKKRLPVARSRRRNQAERALLERWVLGDNECNRGRVAAGSLSSGESVSVGGVIEWS
jgi:hypothetical protein